LTPRGYLCFSKGIILGTLRSYLLQIVKINIKKQVKKKDYGKLWSDSQRDDWRYYEKR
jgi:hypothetical protein